MRDHIRKKSRYWTRNLHSHNAL